MSNRYGYDPDDVPQPRSTIPAKAAAPKAKKPQNRTRAARKFAADNFSLRRSPERQKWERVIRPAMPVERAIVRAVLRDPEASLAELIEKMDGLGYQISDFTLSDIKRRTQFVIREAEALGLFGPFPGK